MTGYGVIISAEAREELAEKWRYLAEAADIDVADRYLDLIDAQCEKLSTMPHRGTPRDDLRPGTRSISIKRNATVFYTVEERQVLILHIAFRGQDLARLFD